MNALATTSTRIQPLPAVLDAAPAFTLLHRRKSIGDYRPASADLDRFNRLLARLGRDHAPLDLDRLATAARQLSADTGTEPPACIAQRIAWLESVAAMAADRAWAAAEDIAACARLVADYAKDPYALLPDWLPRIGHLDDAIVMDAAWPTLHDELARYRDFLRLRALEAVLRGCEPEQLHFDRHDWEVARHDEAALLAHRRHVRETSYVPEPAPMFRIH